jgi:hypothetical protein
MKTKPITLRFEQEHLDLLMEKEGYETPGKALNFLLARYYWGHQLNPAGPSAVAQVPVGDVKTGNGKPMADLPKSQSLDRILYDSYCEKLKAARSIEEFERLDQQIQLSDLDGPQKKELRFLGIGLSKKLD